MTREDALHSMKFHIGQIMSDLNSIDESMKRMDGKLDKIERRLNLLAIPFFIAIAFAIAIIISEI